MAGMITLSDLQAALQPASDDWPVVFDFGQFTPAHFHSQLQREQEAAIGYMQWTLDFPPTKAGELKLRLLEILTRPTPANNATGSPADIQLHHNAPLWVALWNEPAHCGVTGVLSFPKRQQIILTTGFIGDVPVLADITTTGVLQVFKPVSSAEVKE
jgi:hypothetical protein